jgi:hypothetical protein
MATFGGTRRSISGLGTGGTGGSTAGINDDSGVRSSGKSVGSGIGGGRQRVHHVQLESNGPMPLVRVDRFAIPIVGVDVPATEVQIKLQVYYTTRTHITWHHPHPHL